MYIIPLILINKKIIIGDIMINKLEKAMLRPVSAIPSILLLLILIFLFLGKFVAQTVVDFTQGILFGTWYYNIITGYTSLFLDPDSLAGCLLIGEYGVLTMVPVYLFGLLLPLVFSFYFILILLQDSGLFNRISLLADKSLSHIGLSGSAVIPMLLGFGCVTAALISTATLPSKRERLIASILLCIAVPCSAQFAVILAIASEIEFKYLVIYTVTIVIIFLISGLMLNLLIPGEAESCKPSYIPLVAPSPARTLSKTIRAAKEFLTDAAPTFVLGGIIMALINYFNGFITIHKWFSPVTSGMLHLPEQATDIFILSIIKKDLGAAGLYSIVSKEAMTDPEITVALVVMTLFVPCFASVMVLIKDRGILTAAFVYFGSFLIAFSVGSVISFLLQA